MTVINKLDESATETVDIVGPLCTPLDTLARDLEIPAAKVGDLVGIFQSGAYGRSASPLGFLSHPLPGEISVSNGQAALARNDGPDPACLSIQSRLHQSA
jgi:diaminopimelate decarboxylase